MTVAANAHQQEVRTSRQQEGGQRAALSYPTRRREALVPRPSECDPANVVGVKRAEVTEQPVWPPRLLEELHHEPVLHRGERGFEVHEACEGLLRREGALAHGFLEVHHIRQHRPTLQKPALVPRDSRRQCWFQHKAHRARDDPVVGVSDVQRPRASWAEDCHALLRVLRRLLGEQEKQALVELHSQGLHLARGVRRREPLERPVQEVDSGVAEGSPY
eukprot:7073227-Pyramimonas_sp.AAC.2